MKTKVQHICIAVLIISLLSASLLTAQDFFTPVSNTGETNAVVIEAATINGVQLSSGDEIGVFDESLCVGAVIYNGSFPLSCTTILRYESPTGDVLPGARTGHSMAFKIWSKDENKAGDATATLEQGGTFGDILTVVNTLATSITNVELTGSNPEKFQLNQNYPNPFNPVTTITFTLPVSGKTAVTVYDIRGRRINTLVNEVMSTGLHQLTWNGISEDGLPVKSGTYLLSVKTANQHKLIKMILLK